VQLWIMTLSMFLSVVVHWSRSRLAGLSIAELAPPICGAGRAPWHRGAFCAYAIEKELQLRRLTKLLVDERVLTAALTNRLRESPPCSKPPRR